MLPGENLQLFKGKLMISVPVEKGVETVENPGRTRGFGDAEHDASYGNLSHFSRLYTFLSIVFIKDVYQGCLRRPKPLLPAARKQISEVLFFLCGSLPGRNFGGNQDHTRCADCRAEVVHQKCYCTGHADIGGRYVQQCQHNAQHHHGAAGHRRKG